MAAILYLFFLQPGIGHAISSVYVLWLNQAEQMMGRLEENISQAQNRESQILDMSQWMAEMIELLQSRLDADILAGDVPKEFEVWL